jgi:peptidoglycan/LPS O-acetylase OafA/YrhL
MGFLRTLLALSVVLDHLGAGATDHLVGGRLAVQLFYVISGFLISYVLTATDHYQGAVGKFYANRFLRLFPIYLAVAALTLAAHVMSGGAFFRIYDALPFSAELFLVRSNIFIMGQDWLMFFGIEHSALKFTGNFAHSEVPLYEGLLVPQAWTLGVEMSFYLVAPFILHSPRRLLALLAASLALRGVLIATGIGLGDPWTYRFFPTELALFLLGSLSHQVLLPRYKAWTQRIKRLPEIGTAVLAVYCVLHFSIAMNQTVRDGLAVLLFAALLPLAFLFQSRHRLDKAIGELSYPIYICHSLVIMFFKWLLEEAHLDQPLLFMALVITSTIAFSALLNSVIADPIERLRSRLRTDDRDPAPASDTRRRPAGAPAQPLGSIRRVP